MLGPVASASAASAAAGDTEETVGGSPGQDNTGQGGGNPLYLTGWTRGALFSKVPGEPRWLVVSFWRVRGRDVLCTCTCVCVCVCVGFVFGVCVALVSPSLLLLLLPLFLYSFILTYRERPPLDDILCELFV